MKNWTVNENVTVTTATGNVCPAKIIALWYDGRQRIAILDVDCNDPFLSIGDRLAVAHLDDQGNCEEWYQKDANGQIVPCSLINVIKVE